MKAIVVDGHTLNPGDLSWDGLKKLAECEIYEKIKTELTIERCQDADIVVTNKIVFDKKTIGSLPKLKFISVTATGYNVIDIDSAKNSNIIVSNVPTYGTKSVAQMVFALLLELTQHVGHHAETVQEGKWCSCDNFCYWDTPLIELDGLTMGIVGFGRTGKTTSTLAEAFGMNVIVYEPYINQADYSGTVFVELKELLCQSDVVSLHCPLTNTNKDMINVDSLNIMKTSAFIINTSRGPLINEKALAEALNNDTIAGAGLDVLSTEPPTNDNPLFSAKNCIITPHIAWATKSARERLMSVTVANVKAFIGNSPINVVS